MKIFLTILGGVPLLWVADRTGYFVSGIVLNFAAYFLCSFAETHALFDENTARRMFFWFPLVISAELYLFADSWPVMSYFFPIVISIVGLLMPLDFLMKDPRHF